MAEVTGTGIFTADFGIVSAPTFPETTSPRYQVALSANYRRSGTAYDQVDRVYPQRYTFVASTAQEIDLFALIAGPRCRLFIIKFETGTHEDAWLTLGGAASNAWASINGLTIYPGTTLNPGGVAISAAGKGLPLSSTSKQLKMTPSAHAFSINLLALGASV